MGHDIVKKKPVKFIRRFLKPDLAIISFWILAGPIALALSEGTIESGFDIFIIGRVSSEYAGNERQLQRLKWNSIFCKLNY